MAYDEATLIDEINNANDGDIIEVTDNIRLTDRIGISKDITIQSPAGNNFKIYQTTPLVRHFLISPTSTGGTLTLKNITLDGMNTGGGAGVRRSGSLILDDGAVIQSCYSTGGGAISSGSTGNDSSAAITMKSGSIIQNCHSDMQGGAVYVGFYGILTMEDGAVIRNCHTKEYGGGVYIAEGSFIMNGGEISNCSSMGGGGIFLFYNDTFPPQPYSVTINAGIIKDCSSPFGGGILFINTQYVAAMSAVVTGNYSGSYGGGIAALDGNLRNVDTSRVSGNTALLTDGPDAQIYVLSQHYSGGSEFTFISRKTNTTPIILLNGEECNLIFFRVLDDHTGEYLIAFCGDLTQGFPWDGYYIEYFLPNVTLNREQTDKVAVAIRAALGGITSYDLVENDDELTLRAYIGQYVIWNIITGYSDSDQLITATDRVREAFGDAAAGYFTEIVAEIRRYEAQTVPSFASREQSGAACYPEYDESDGKYKITLTDTNGVLRYFTVDTDSLPQGVEVVLDYDGNTMTIICEDKGLLLKGKAVIRLVSLFYDGNYSVYFHPLYQDLVIPDLMYDVMIDGYINLLMRTTSKKPCVCYSKTTKCRKTITGCKKWVDNGNAYDTRPNAVEIILLRDGEFYQSTVISSEDYETYTFCCVPIWKTPGRKYKYKIDEVTPDGYRKTIEGYNITNTLIS